MCDRPWSEVAAEAKAAGTKPSAAEVLAHAHELVRRFEEWDPDPANVAENEQRNG